MQINSIYRILVKFYKQQFGCLTYRSLTFMSLAIFGVFFLIANLWLFIGPAPDSYMRIYAAYGKGLAHGERFLYHYLQDHDESKAWKIFVVQRGKLLRTEQWLAHKTVPDHLMPGSFFAPFLSEKAFLQFISSARSISPSVLLAWYKFSKHGLDEALVDLQNSSTQESINAAIEMCIADKSWARALNFCDQALKADPNNALAIRSTLKILKHKEQFHKISLLLQQPEYKKHADARFIYRFLCQRQHYWQMLPYLFKSNLENYTWQWVLAAIGVGSCWFIFCIHMGLGWQWPVSTKILAVIAVLLGMMSALACLAVVVIQNDLLQYDSAHSEEMEMRFNLLYCIFGIGLREEVIKILFLLPLAPILVRLKDDLAIITIASLVGLGFAIEENINYYLASGGSAIISRFLTANFFHLTLTGYGGYYLIKAMQTGGQNWRIFFLQLAQIIMCHAIYDFFLIEPMVANYSIFATMLYIWIAQQYLRLVLAAGGRHKRSVSLTRVFVACITGATGINYLLMAANFGIFEGLRLTAMGLLGVIIITYMFFYEFDEVVG